MEIDIPSSSSKDDNEVNAIGGPINSGVDSEVLLPLAALRVVSMMML